MKQLKYLLLIIALCVLMAACNSVCVHEYRSEITTEATCTQEGERTFTCIHCQHSYVEAIEATGHDYQPDAIEKEATCAEEGIRIYLCSACGDSTNQSIERLPHTLGETVITKEPNCTLEGECMGTCTVCGAEQVTQSVAPNGVHVLVNKVTRAATCTDPGEGVNECEFCQYSEPCQYEPAEHTYGNDQVLSPASCTKDGTVQKTCSLCAFTTQETVPAFGHNWSGASCTQAGVCATCGVTGSKTDHNYVTVSDEKRSHPFASYRVKKCNSCGTEKSEYYTGMFVYNLDSITSTLISYARSLGFNAVWDMNVSNPEDYSCSGAVWYLELPGWGPNQLIKEGKQRIDYAYSNKAPNPELYTLYICAYYSESGSTGSGTFHVFIGLKCSDLAP